MRGIFEGAKAEHELHYLDVPDEACLQRLKERNTSGAHDYQTSEKEFEIITSYFVAPETSEGFNVILHKCDE